MTGPTTEALLPPGELAELRAIAAATFVHRATVYEPTSSRRPAAKTVETYAVTASDVPCRVRPAVALPLERVVAGAVAAPDAYDVRLAPGTTLAATAVLHVTGESGGQPFALWLKVQGGPQVRAVEVTRVVRCVPTPPVVAAVVPTSTVVTLSAPTTAEDDTAPLTATALVLPTGAPQAGLWSSDAPGVATVDATTGALTRHGPGAAVITFTPTGHPGAAGSATLTVTAAAAGGEATRENPGARSFVWKPGVDGMFIPPANNAAGASVFGQASGNTGYRYVAGPGVWRTAERLPLAPSDSLDPSIIHDKWPPGPAISYEVDTDYLPGATWHVFDGRALDGTGVPIWYATSLQVTPSQLPAVRRYSAVLAVKAWQPADVGRKVKFYFLLNSGGAPVGPVVEVTLAAEPQEVTLDHTFAAPLTTADRLGVVIDSDFSAGDPTRARTLAVLNPVPRPGPPRPLRFGGVAVVGGSPQTVETYAPAPIEPGVGLRANNPSGNDLLYSDDLTASAWHVQGGAAVVVSGEDAPDASQYVGGAPLCHVTLPAANGGRIYHDEVPIANPVDTTGGPGPAYPAAGRHLLVACRASTTPTTPAFPAGGALRIEVAGNVGGRVYRVDLPFANRDREGILRGWLPIDAADQSTTFTYSLSNPGGAPVTLGLYACQLCLDPFNTQSVRNALRHNRALPPRTTGVRALAPMVRTSLRSVPTLLTRRKGTLILKFMLPDDPALEAGTTRATLPDGDPSDYRARLLCDTGPGGTSLDTINLGWHYYAADTGWILDADIGQVGGRVDGLNAHFRTPIAPGEFAPGVAHTLVLRWEDGVILSVDHKAGSAARQRYSDPALYTQDGDASVTDDFAGGNVYPGQDRDWDSSAAAVISAVQIEYDRVLGDADLDAAIAALPDVPAGGALGGVDATGARVA